ncbi:beta-class carbonic anhydrase [Sediminibacillus albus]|uniref:carbonic anhydrase n=1 Tax=Sediminibacillus albus TaxID=407036 RepID=A0A1G9CAP6_9BACI|nr:carbonic anhydrase [Sediminibacillus albus]SDK48748.1 carbonic anhydrase [Sediminibacillus albus]
MLLEEMLQHNVQFMEKGTHTSGRGKDFPNKNAVILTCMEIQLDELLPKALGLNSGDVQFIRNAGAILTEPDDSVMRSLLIAVYELRADEIFVIGHHDCWLNGFRPEGILERMKVQGITEEEMSKFSDKSNLADWLRGFDQAKEGIKTSVQNIENHPLMPEDTPVHGLLINTDSGKLDIVVNGY